MMINAFSENMFYFMENQRLADCTMMSSAIVFVQCIQFAFAMHFQPHNHEKKEWRATKRFNSANTQKCQNHCDYTQVSKDFSLVHREHSHIFN